LKIDRKLVYDKLNGYCAYCGERIKFKDMQVDHIIPKARFHVGHFCYHVDSIQNLNPACRICNNWKSVHMVDEFRHEISQQVIRLRKYSAQFRLAERYGLIRNTKEPVIFYFEARQTDKEPLTHGKG